MPRILPQRAPASGLQRRTEGRAERALRSCALAGASFWEEADVRTQEVAGAARRAGPRSGGDPRGRRRARRWRARRGRCAAGGTSRRVRGQGGGGGEPPSAFVRKHDAQRLRRLPIAVVREKLE